MGFGRSDGSGGVSRRQVTTPHHHLCRPEDGTELSGEGSVTSSPSLVPRISTLEDGGNPRIQAHNASVSGGVLCLQSPTADGHSASQGEARNRFDEARFSESLLFYRRRQAGAPRVLLLEPCHAFNISRAARSMFSHEGMAAHGLPPSIDLAALQRARGLHQRSVVTTARCLSALPPETFGVIVCSRTRPITRITSVSSTRIGTGALLYLNPYA